MAWTSPRTWTVGQIVTAAQLNVDIRDNENALSTHGHTGAAGEGVLIGGVSYTTTTRFQDDFMGGGTSTGLIGEKGWSLTLVSTGGVTPLTAVASHPGILRMSTGATSSSVARITPSATVFTT